MKLFLENFKKLSLSAKVRLVLQLLVYANQVVLVLGQTPLSDNQAYQIVSLLLTIAITMLTYWKNNDWTGMARTAGKVLDILKDGEVSEDEIEEFITSHAKKE